MKTIPGGLIPGGLTRQRMEGAPSRPLDGRTADIIVSTESLCASSHIAHETFKAERVEPDFYEVHL